MHYTHRSPTGRLGKVTSSVIPPLATSTHALQTNRQHSMVFLSYCEQAKRRSGVPKMASRPAIGMT